MTAPGRELEGAGGATVTGLFASAELAAGELVAGRFRVEELLGIGGMGVVYRARDEQLGVPVALKLLRPELASRPDAFARFRQEILLARQVSSAHVVRIHDLVQHEGRWLISMDYVDGASLEKLIDEQGKLSTDQALRIARDVAEGLAAAHRKQVVHRDLKPANVLVDAAGNAYISDFGVARSAGVTGVTGSGVVVGTPEYLSPEQARADAVDARSDLYALGLIVHEMLAGVPPFPGGTPAETLAQRIVRSPPTLAKSRPDLPGWIVRLVARLTQLKPARRFQRAEDVVRAIETKHVPGQLPERRGVAIVLVSFMAVAALVVGWRELAPRFGPAPAAPATTVVAAPPVVALPLAASAEDAALAAALDGLLRAGLAAAGSSVDGERLARLQKQLGYDDDTARRNAGAIAARVGAKRTLLPALVRDGERWRVTLATGAGAPLDGGAVTREALAVALRELVTRSGATVDADGWPSGGDALAAYGDGELARRDGKLADADAAYARAVAAEPRFALAWLARLEIAPRDSDAAATLARSAIDALRGARGRAVERARALASLAGGEADAAVARLAPLAAARPFDGTTRVALARAQEAAGDDAAARRTLAALVADDDQNAAAWLALGRLAVRGGEAQRGVDDYLLRAQVLFTRLGDRRALGETANAIGMGHERLGQMDEAVAQFERAAQLREQAGDASGAAASLRNLSAARAVKGDFAQAAADLDKARTLLAPLGDSEGLADVANDAGLLAEEQGDYAAALVAYREALAQRQPQGNDRLLAESLLNVGFAYFQTGEFDNAATYWKQSLARADGVQDVAGVVRAKQSLGLLDTARGEWRAARASLDASLATAEAQQMAEEQAVSLTYLAELDRLEGRFDSARTRAARARALFAERDDARGTAEIDLIVAQAALDAGDAEAANAALAGFAGTPPGNREQASMLAQRRSELALLRGDADGARREAAQARTDAQAAHGTAVLVAAELADARAALRTGATRDADAALARAGDVLARFPSLPLLLERALVRTEGGDAAAYREAQARIARLPAYGRARLLEAAAAQKGMAKQ